MKKITLLLSAVLLACATNLWAGDVVVYKLNTATTTIATNNKYVSVNATPCASDDKTSEVTTANWKITLGSNQSNDPKGLWLGANSSNKSNEKLGNGSFAEANAIATAVGATTSSTCYAALISETELPNISKIKFSYAGVGGKNPEQIWILASGDKGTTWSVVATSTKMVAAKDTTFALSTTIASSRYALVCCHKSDYFTVRVPVLTFYKTVSETKTVSVAVAKGQEEMGSVVMSYKANSEEAWTEATESAVEIAGEGAEVFQFVATPADGYKFAGWTTTGDITLNDKNAATAVGNSATKTSVVTANFERDATLQSLTITGTATKLNYFVGDTFDPAGLVVTATYSDGATDHVTDQVDWTFTPAELALATTAVSVVATWNEVSSDPYEVKDIVVTEPVRFEKWVGEVVEGEYLLVDAGETDAVAMNTTVTSDRLQYSKVVINAEGQIIEPSADVVWKIARDSAFWTIANGEKFAAGNGTKNQIQLLQAVGNQARWEISATGTGLTIVNYGNQTAEVNATLRRNGTYGFACYGTTTGTAPVLYKKVTDETFVTVTVTVNDASMGSVYGGGRYAVGATATLTAVPAAGYKLIGWSNDNQITTTTQSFTVEEEITITANFAKGATAIDNVAVETPAVKTIENGQLVILRDGVKYNAMGVRLQ